MSKHKTTESEVNAKLRELATALENMHLPRLEGLSGVRVLEVLPVVRNVSEGLQVYLISVWQDNGIETKAVYLPGHGVDAIICRLCILYAGSVTRYNWLRNETITIGIIVPHFLTPQEAILDFIRVVDPYWAHTLGIKGAAVPEGE